MDYLFRLLHVHLWLQGSRDGAMVIQVALAFHQCDPGSIQHSWQAICAPTKG